MKYTFVVADEILYFVLILFILKIVFLPSFSNTNKLFRLYCYYILFKHNSRLDNK